MASCILAWCLVILFLPVVIVLWATGYAIQRFI